VSGGGIFGRRLPRYGVNFARLFTGTSKRNRIEHRLFWQITQNWRGRPSTDRRAVIELIGATTTRTGLKVAWALDPRICEKGLKVSDAETARLDITGDAFHPEWNSTIRPRRPKA